MGNSTQYIKNQPARAASRRRWVWPLFLVSGIALGIVVRWLFPAADPPLHRQTGAILYDEVWGFAARNGVLFGSWQQDAWQPWVVCPIHTLLLQASFRIFGLTAFGLRFLAMFSGTLLIVCAYAQARAARFSRMAALIAAFALATSWSLTGFSKCMTLEPTLMLFFSLGFLVLLLAESRRSITLYAAAGICAGLAALCKTSGVVMALSLFPFLALGAVATPEQSPSIWRLLRTSTFFAVFGAVVALGFWYWMRPNFDSFYQLTIKTSLLDRAQNPLFMRAYKAVFWFDSQAFFTTPFWLAALLTLLPALGGSPLPKSPRKRMQRFAVKLSVATLLCGLVMMINVDVPARRLVYFSIPLALLTAAIWDAHSADALRPSSRLTALIVRCLFIIAGLILSGWLVSPNGGLVAFVTPRTAAWLLFDLHAKTTYKIVWLLLGLSLGALLWRFRAPIWRNRRAVLACALIAQAVCYVAESGLWIVRRTYTGEEASVAIGRLVPPGAYILGADAATRAWFNDTRPLFWSPKEYRFANHDDAVIERDYNPQYLLLNALDLEKLRKGQYPCSPYIASFLHHELARLPVYEYHESFTLNTDLVLLQRDPQ